MNETYKKLFKKFGTKIKMISNTKKTNSNFWLQSFILENPKLRNKLIQKCIKNNIFIKPIWKPLHKNNYVKRKFCQPDMKNTDYLFKRLICLPSSYNILNK